jgi:hypothetical protein
MRLKRRVLAISAVLCVVARPAASQVRSASELPIDVYAYGGLLGRVEGFREHPPGDAIPLEPPFDRTTLWGGAVGLRQTLERIGALRDAVRLVTGDNLPADIDAAGWSIDHPFWQELLATRPDVIALGDEDFIRGLANLPTAGVFARWLHEFRQAVRTRSAGYTNALLASNAAVRVRSPGMNVVKQKNAELAVDKNASIGWQSTLVIEHDGKPSQLVFALGRNSRCPFPDEWQDGARPAHCEDFDPDKTTLTQTADDVWHSALAFVTPFRPATRYFLSMRRAGIDDSTFEFETDRALTPFTEGLPYATVTRGTVRFTVAALVSPDLGEQFVTEALEWTHTRASNCTLASGAPARTCTLEFHEPAAALSRIVEWSRDRDTRVAAPMMLISSLEDVPSLDLLSQLADVRVLVLHPENRLLGRAATPVQDSALEKRRSGDLGYNGVLDAQFPGVARATVRPEWFGETIQRVRAVIKTVPGAPRVEFTGVTTEMTPVAGRPLCWSPAGTPAAPHVKYSVRTNDAPTFLQLPGTFPLYPPARPSVPIGGGIEQGNLWTAMAEFLSLFLDTARERTNADVAILPTTFVDEEVIGQFAGPPARTLDWLSEHVFHQAVYRPEPVVRARVTADALPGLLTKLFAEPGYCAAGLGLPCPVRSFEARHLRINGRPEVPGHHYFVAVPESVARSFDLAYSDRSRVDIVHPTAHRIAAGAAVPLSGPRCEDDSPSVVLTSAAVSTSADPEPLAARLEKSRTRFFFAQADPFSVEYRKVSASESARDENTVFPVIPLVGRQVKLEEQQKYNFKGDAGYAFNDRLAIRAQTAIKYARSEVGDEESITEDEWRYGGRFDVRVGRLTFFGGFFYQRQFERLKVRTFTPTRRFRLDPQDADTEVPGVEQSGPVIRETRPAIRYRFVAGGAELPRWGRSWFSLENGVVEFDRGSFNDVPLAPRLAGEPIDVAEFIRLGPQGLLNTLYAQNSPLIREGAEITFDTDRDEIRDSFAKARLVFAQRVRLKPGAGWKGLELQTDAEVRWFPWTLPAALLPRASIDVKTKALWPVGRLLKVGPFVDVYRARARDTDWFMTTSAGVTLESPLFWKRH